MVNFRFFLNLCVGVTVGTLCLVIEHSLFEDDFATHMMVLHNYMLGYQKVQAKQP